MRTIGKIKAELKAAKETPKDEMYAHEIFQRLQKIQALTGELRLALTNDIPLDRLEEICNAERLIGETVYCAFDGVTKVIERQISGYVANPGIVLLADYGHGLSNNLCELKAIGKTVFLTREEAKVALKG